MDTVFQFIKGFHTIYGLCIFAWALMSWIPMISPQLAYNDIVVSIRKFLDSVVDPYVRIFRGLIPPVRMGGTMLDLSAIVAILAWFIVGGIVLNVLASVMGVSTGVQ